MVFALILSVVLTATCYLFCNQIVHAFLSDEKAFEYAVEFSRILLCTSFLFGIFYVLISTLQAMVDATSSLIVNLSRQGLIYIPMLFILQALMGINGLAWAQPVADILSTALAAFLCVRATRKMMRLGKAHS